MNSLKSAILLSVIGVLMFSAQNVKAVPFIYSTPGTPGSASPIDGLMPSRAAARGPAVPLTVNGTGFVNGSKIMFESMELTTTFVNANRLTATIPANQLESARLLSIYVLNPDGTISSPNRTFLVYNVAPTLTDISPTSRAAQSGDTTLTVNGTNFFGGTVVKLKGPSTLPMAIRDIELSRTEDEQTSTRLKVNIPASRLTNQFAGTHLVIAVNPDPILNVALSTSGSGVSNSKSFTITTAPNPVPTIASIDPASRPAGQPGPFDVIITGTGFIPGISVGKRGDASRALTVNSPTSATLHLFASDAANAGTFNITVFNPAPSGGTSNVVSFTVSAGTEMTNENETDNSLIDYVNYPANNSTQTPIDPLSTTVASISTSMFASFIFKRIFNILV